MGFFSILKTKPMIFFSAFATGGMLTAYLK